MTDATFRPILYLKQGCPFCFKVRLFLLEAGLTDAVEIRAFTPGTPEEASLRAELAPHLPKVSFPAAELEPSRFSAESDDIVAALAAASGRDLAAMTLLQDYVEGPLKQVGVLWKQNQALQAASA